VVHLVRPLPRRAGRPRTPAATCPDPDQWDQTLEDAFVKKISDERKRVKSGSYDTYALDLSRVRGSFK
jgi:hypothetical protein